MVSIKFKNDSTFDYLKLKVINVKYDHILLDEIQDCTEADFEIFYAMIKDPNNFTIGGYLAQSIHLGNAARIP